LFDSFDAFAGCSLEQIKSGLWPTHLFRQIAGAVTAYSYDGTKSSATVIIHPLFFDFNGREKFRVVDVGFAGDSGDFWVQRDGKSW
jgi:hypothetical protein